MFNNIFELITTGADFSQFVSLSKNIADEKLFKQIIDNQKIIIGLLTKGDEIMKILKDLIKKSEDTLEEIEFYAEKALHFKQDHKSLADTYNKIGEMHVTIYNMLHTEMVNLIDEQKRMGHQPPPEMLAIYEYEHEKLIKEFAEAKTMLDEYKKSY